MIGDQDPREWQETPPDHDGWWMFREGCDKSYCVLVLGTIVAYDDDWEEAMGREPSGDFSENYWEGTSTRNMTFGPTARGTWSYVGKPEGGFL